MPLFFSEWFRQFDLARDPAQGAWSSARAADVHSQTWPHWAGHLPQDSQVPCGLVLVLLSESSIMYNSNSWQLSYKTITWTKYYKSHLCRITWIKLIPHIHPVLEALISAQRPAILLMWGDVFLHWCGWPINFSGKWHRDPAYLIPGVLRHCSGHIFKCQKIQRSFWPLKIRQLQCLKMLVTICPVMQCQFPELVPYLDCWFLWCSLFPPDKCEGSISNQMTTASSTTFSNSLCTDHRTIQCYRGWTIDSIVQ